MKHVCDGCPNAQDDCYPTDMGYCDLRSNKVPANIRRVSGQMVCSKCKKPYYHHPSFPGATWATVLCSGEVVKL